MFARHSYRSRRADYANSRSRLRPGGAKVSRETGAICNVSTMGVAFMSARFVALLFGLAAFAVLAAGAALILNLHHADEAPTKRQVFVGGSRFSLLSSYLRPSSRSGGRLDQLDLAAFFPDFTPAGDVGDINAGTDLAERFEKLVFISIKPADASLDPAERPTQALCALSRTERMEPSRRPCRSSLSGWQSVRRPGALFRCAGGARFRRALRTARRLAQDAQFLHL